MGHSLLGKPGYSTSASYFGMVMRILVCFIFGLVSDFHQLLNTIQLEYDYVPQGCRKVKKFGGASSNWWA